MYGINDVGDKKHMKPPILRMNSPGKIENIIPKGLRGYA